MKIFPELPSDLGTAGSRRIRRFIAESQKFAEQIAASPEQFLNDDATIADLLAEQEAGVAAIESARAELATRAAAVEAEGEEQETTEDAEVEETDAELAVEDEEDLTPKLAELAARARVEVEETVEGDDEEEGEDDEAAVTAAVVEPEKPRLRPVARPPKPSADRRGIETKVLQPLVAAADGVGVHIGDDVDAGQIAKMMIKRRKDFGNIAEGTEDKVPIARADWSEGYGAERTLTADADVNWERINRVVDQELIKRNLAERVSKSLTASGGLCAPVTPYYQLQMISMANRPVRAALPSFNADRGGLRFAAPAALSAVTTAVGTKTVEEDSGSEATKTCQVIPCPSFSEVDVETIYHCIQFGNLGARTFPELVAQWNSLVLAAHARTAETVLLDGIDSASTQVTAVDLGLGASADFLSEVLVAAVAMRSRHRMDPDAVLRSLIPRWVLDMLVSDVYRSQFGRFDMTQEKFTALLRAGNVEPTYYIDSATGDGQVFGTQGAGALLTFPSTAKWFLYPEGSFLYLDGGVLELGLVRDSVLNSTNDFQIFGESFENVAFVGVESLAVTSDLCDSGIVAGPNDSADCPDYSEGIS